MKYIIVIEDNDDYDLTKCTKNEALDALVGAVRYGFAEVKEIKKEE